MNLTLTVIAGPHLGKEFVFDGHDTFLVGRVNDAHLQLSYDDPYFSRRHFVVETNPPRCRVLDLKSRNGTCVNGVRIEAVDIRDGDEISAGHTVFKVSVPPTDPGQQVTQLLPSLSAATGVTAEYRPPTRELPGYQLGALLGAGGMGQVFRATRLSDGQEIAIKTIIPAAGADRKQVERFVRECRILGELSHPNIVRFHDVAEADGVIFLAMELIDGPDTGKVLRERGPMAVRTAVRIMCQTLDGLAHAHGKRFVHRDLKPANILIAETGAKRMAKLADFGLARVYETSRLSGLTMQGEVGGTPAFMAPEQVTHYRDVRPAADQYSAAATLYRLLTAKFPHDLPSKVVAQLIHVSTEEPVPIRDRRADLPAGLATVIHKALSREPPDRYPDVRAFRTALAPFA